MICMTRASGAAAVISSHHHNVTNMVATSPFCHISHYDFETGTQNASKGELTEKKKIKMMQSASKINYTDHFPYSLTVSSVTKTESARLIQHSVKDVQHSTLKTAASMKCEGL